jgi:hypothetical protein
VLLYEGGVLAALKVSLSSLEDTLDNSLALATERLFHLLLLACSVGYFFYLQLIRLRR